MGWRCFGRRVGDGDSNDDGKEMKRESEREREPEELTRVH